MNKRAILYLRFSDPKQMGGTSIETQEQISRNSCLAEEFDVIETTKNEAVSASKTNTERVIDLLDFCKERQGKFEVLMVFKLDRFARSQEQHHWLRGQLLKIGIILRSATERIDESPSGRLVEGVLAAVNEYDNEVKRERVKLAMWSRVEHGLYPWGPPIGYKPDVRPAGVKLIPHVIDDTCSEVIKELFTRYSTGVITKAEISRELNKRKIKNYKGKVLKFSQTTIQTLLGNQYYIALLKHKDGRLIKGLHVSLIDPELFQKCQDVHNGIARHWTRKRLVNNPDFPLRRFVSCGYCGQSITACWAQGKRIKYPYYYCRNSNCKQNGKMIKQSDFHNAFYDYVALVKPKEEFIELFREVFVRRYEQRKKEFKGDYIRKLEEIKQLENEQAWLIEKGKKGIIPDDLLQKQLQESEQAITIAKFSLSEIHNEELEIDALLSEAEVFIRTPELAWYCAMSEAKLKYQRMIFPKGLSYPFDPLSNTELGLPFKLIRDFAVKNTASVTRVGVEPTLQG